VLIFSVISNITDLKIAYQRRNMRKGYREKTVIGSMMKMRTQFL